MNRGSFCGSIPIEHSATMICDTDSEFRVPQLRKSPVSNCNSDRQLSALSTGSFTLNVESQ